MTSSDLPGPRYYDDPADWDRLAAACTGEAAGFDTEFYGVSVRDRESTDTCCGRAIVHVWSLALPTKRLHPRGFYRAVSAVLPAVALVRPSIRAWLSDPNSPKIGLMSTVDAHAAENTVRLLDPETGGDFRVAGLVDLLSAFRFLYPERVAPGPGYSLDSIGRDFLGRGKIDSFEEVLSEPNVVEVERRKTEHRMVCECGTVPCRRPSKVPGHTRTKETVVARWNESVVRGTRLIPLETVLPGHERWERLVAYSGVDAELAVEGEQVVQTGFAQLTRPIPW